MPEGSIVALSCESRAVVELRRDHPLRRGANQLFEPIQALPDRDFVRPDGLVIGADSRLEVGGQDGRKRSRRREQQQGRGREDPPGHHFSPIAASLLQHSGCSAARDEKTPAGFPTGVFMFSS